MTDWRIFGRQAAKPEMNEASPAHLLSSSRSKVSFLSLLSSSISRWSASAIPVKKRMKIMSWWSAGLWSEDFLSRKGTNTLEAQPMQEPQALKRSPNCFPCFAGPRMRGARKSTNDWTPTKSWGSSWLKLISDTLGYHRDSQIVDF